MALSVHDVVSMFTARSARCRRLAERSSYLPDDGTRTVVATLEMQGPEEQP